MDNDSNRLRMAQWILERNLHFIATAEVKVGVLVAINTAMLGTVAAAFNAVSQADRSAWGILFAVIAGICGLCAIVCAATAVLPRITGPKSLLFFGSIHKLDDDQYAHAFKAASEADILDDCLNQISRNAEIACEKFAWVKKSMYWSFLSILPWVAALAMLMKG